MEWIGNLYWGAMLVTGLVLNVVTASGTPEPVAKTVTERYPKMEVVEVQRDTEAGQPVVEVKLRSDAQVIEAEFAEDGAFCHPKKKLLGQACPKPCESRWSKRIQR